jgi:hypothetical protein
MSGEGNFVGFLAWSAAYERSRSMNAVRRGLPDYLHAEHVSIKLCGGRRVACIKTDVVKE